MMNIQNENFCFSLLVFFKAMIENGSLTQTAEYLGLSQATASRNLSRLRLLFQDPLFVRTRYGMVPTARAKEIYPQLVDAIASFENLFLPQQADPKSFTGIIKISVVDNGVLLFISKVIDELMEKAPYLKIELAPLYPDLYEKIESDAIQLAIYPEAPLPQDFHEAILFEDRYTCVVHKNHPLAHYAKINRIPSAEEINQYKKLEIVVRGSKNGHTLSQSPYPKAHQQTQIWTPYFLTAPALLENSLLTLTLPYRTARYFAQTSSLVILPCPKPYKTYEARMIWHHRTHNHCLLRWVRQLIIDKFKKPE